MHLKKNLKNNVQKYRVWKNLTQQELADLTGISVSAVRLIEREIVTPQIKIRNKLINFFGVSMDQMFYKEEA